MCRGLHALHQGGYTVRSPKGTDNQQTFSKRKQAVQVHRVVTAGASSRGQALATVTRLGVRHASNAFGLPARGADLRLTRLDESVLKGGTESALGHPTLAATRTEQPCWQPVRILL